MPAVSPRTIMIVCCLLACCAAAWSQLPQPANAGSSAATLLVTRDAKGNVLDVRPNPESAIQFGAPAAGPAPAKSGSVSGMRFVNQVLSLALVLVMAYVAMLLLKKYQTRRGAGPVTTSGGRPAQTIRLLETSSLGQGRTVHLLQVGGRCLLVGASMQQVSLLGDLTDDPRVIRLTDEVPETTAPAFPAAFQQLLSRYMGAPAAEKENR